DTGLPIMRALWIHDPQDPIAAGRGDEYLWGPDLLVAPVVEKGATARTIYLPQGDWYDFWTGERVAGGREVTRPVDLETMPLYVRAGAVLPIGPVKQYADEPVDAPITLRIHPGASGTSYLYEDDCISFDYKSGEFMRLLLAWNDADRTLSIALADGARMLGPTPRRFEVTVVGTNAVQSVEFSGQPVTVRL